MNTYLPADLCPHKNIDLRPLKKFEMSVWTNEHLTSGLVKAPYLFTGPTDSYQLLCYVCVVN